MSSSLIPPRILFRFAVPCRKLPPGNVGVDFKLSEKYRLPTLHELEGNPTFAEVRVGWNEAGLAFSAEVTGKKQFPWCREGQLEESDGLHVWLDTRDTQTIHRASRFCHRFVFMPSGGGPRRQDPVAEQIMIHRAREHPKPARTRDLVVRAKTLANGYFIQSWINGEGLNGFDPADASPRLGFQYCLLDRERGEQTFSVSNEFPYSDDPSVWGTLELAS
ncbi:MAG: hypothetical protein MPJ50_11060 [Pirellulales bacterium]|nr:hypothetical protein [Pirellulales bacterium]